MLHVKPTFQPYLLVLFRITGGYSLLVFFLLSAWAGLAQNETKQWRFGNKAGLDFNTNPPGIVTTNTMVNNSSCASVADGSGNLLFYTDGNTVWDHTNSVMANGTGLFGNGSITSLHNCALIIKKPGSSAIYYVFTSPTLFGTAPMGLYYSEVNMSLAAGNGSVTVKNTLLSAGSNSVNCGKLTATMHCNGTDVWVVARDYYYIFNGPGNATNVNNSFRAFLVTNSGVNTAPVVSTPIVYSYVATGYAGYDMAGMKLSPHGKKLVCPGAGGGGNIELFDFDNVTGLVSNPMVLVQGYSEFSCEFSPDGTKLYAPVFPNKLLQFDLCAGTSSAAIIASAYTIAMSSYGQQSDLQLAPDGKIYIALQSQTALDVINNPNGAGTACGYSAFAQSIAPKVNTYCLPNFMGSYFQVPPHSSFTYTENIAFGCRTASFNCVPGCGAAVGYSLTNVLWNFGEPSSNSNSSTLMNPIHAFADTGIYTVKLFLYYSCGGGTDTVSRLVHITVPCPAVSGTSLNCVNPTGTATVLPQGIGPYSYTWMPTGQTGSIATGLNPGSYTITVFDAGYNVTYTTSTILYPMVPLTGTLNNSTQVPCHGATTGTACISDLAGGSGNQSYHWSLNGIILYTTSCVQNLGAGNWYILVTDAVTGCMLSQSFVITEPAPLSLTITPSTPTACVNASVVLNGTCSGGTSASGAYNYTWSNGPVAATYTISSSTSGTYVYTLSATDDHTCSATTTLAVTFINNPTLTVSNATICPQQTAILSAQGASSYTWNTGFSGATLTNTPAGSTHYTVVGNTMGCTDTAMATVVVMPHPNPGIIANSNSLCVNDTIVMEGSGGIGYIWHTPNGLMVNGKILKTKVLAGSSGLFILTVSDANNCMATTTKSITVFNLPDGSIVSNHLQGCAPLCPDLSFKASAQSFSISSLSWQVNTTTYPASQIQPCFNVPGNVVIGASLKDVNNCVNTVTTVATVYPKPTAGFSYSPQHPVEGLDEVQFEDQSQGAIAFHWEFGNLYQSKYQYPSYLFLDAGTYPIALVVSNQWNCKDTLVQPIVVEDDFTVYLPNTFTPNEDGRNDLFFPFMRGIRSFNFYIFNRWGEKLFVSSDVHNGWDGTYKGQPCQEDVYVWKLEVTGNTNTTKKMTGFVTLYR